MKKKLTLSSPWVTYYKKIEALFAQDDDVKVIYDESENTVKLLVDGTDKANALSQLMPSEKVFGNVTLKICVVPANTMNDSKIGLFKKAFEGNKSISKIKSTTDGTFDFNYIVFNREVVQFPNDDISDINGNYSTLYQEIAKDVFENHEGIYFCTEGTSFRF